ncbi:abc transporter [Neofusicoccum parvum]|uniref:Abc transporter n=1 Tax=Neofusicoccum parvum TaxID=310453 RepID=A0ACB5RXZ0_9PEZI|nr:abc transporter [Neofusicoccum parvum]
MSTSKQQPTSPRPDRSSQTPLTPTSPRIPGAWPPSSAGTLSPLPPHPKSPPPTPPVSAGLSSSLPSALSRLTLGHGGDPPNTPVGGFMRGGDAAAAAAVAHAQSRCRRRQRRLGSSGSDGDGVEGSPHRKQQSSTRGQRPRASTNPTPPAQQFAPRLPLHFQRERRRSGATSPQSPRVTKTRGWSSSSSSDDSGNISPGKQVSSKKSSPRRPADFRNRIETGPATVLRLEGVGAVVIEEAPRRAISAKATGGVKLVDMRRPSGRRSDAGIFKDGEINVGQEESYQEAGRLSEPGPGLSGRERVRRTLKSKRMEALRMDGASPGGIVEFGEKALPSTPMSMQPTPREMYYQQDSSASTSPSLSPSPARTPSPTTSLPLRFPMPPTHLPGRLPLRPLSETSTLVNSSIDIEDTATSLAYPLTPIATDLGSLAMIAALGEDSPSARRASRSASRPSRSAHSSRARTLTENSRSSSVSTTSIRLRSGSVVTVIPPEQTAWQRTAYVAGPIRLNNFSNLANNSSSTLPGLPHQRGKAGSVASLDAFQDAVETLTDNPTTQGRRASDENVLEDLVEYFEDFGINPGSCEKDELDCFWSSDLDDDRENRKSHGSFGTGWLSPPPEKPVPAVPVSFPAGLSMAAKRMSALSGGMGAVEVIEMQDVERDSLKRTPSLLSRGSRSSSERRSRLAGPNGQRTRLRRLMMSAGGIL